MATAARRVIRALAGLVLLLWPPAVTADPIAITGGLVETNVGSAAARVTLQGDGFFLQTGAGFSSPLAPLCSPCAVGTPVTLNGTYTQGVPFGGTLTIDGSTYTSLIFQGGSGTFTTREVPLPATGMLALPFQFSGLLLAFSDPSDLEPLIARTLIGTGTATATFTRVAGGEPLFDLQSEGLQYRFGAAAVPEPTSMLLVGTGLAAAVWRRRR